MSEILDAIEQYGMNKTAARLMILDPKTKKYKQETYLQAIGRAIKSKAGKAKDALVNAKNTAVGGIKRGAGSAWRNKGKVGLGALAGIGLGALGAHLRNSN